VSHLEPRIQVPGESDENELRQSESFITKYISDKAKLGPLVLWAASRYKKYKRSIAAASSPFARDSRLQPLTRMSMQRHKLNLKMPTIVQEEETQLLETKDGSKFDAAEWFTCELLSSVLTKQQKKQMIEYKLLKETGPRQEEQKDDFTMWEYLDTDTPLYYGSYGIAKEPESVEHWDKFIAWICDHRVMHVVSMVEEVEASHNLLAIIPLLQETTTPIIVGQFSVSAREVTLEEFEPFRKQLDEIARCFDVSVGLAADGSELHKFKWIQVDEWHEEFPIEREPCLRLFSLFSFLRMHGTTVTLCKWGEVQGPTLSVLHAVVSSLRSQHDAGAEEPEVSVLQTARLMTNALPRAIPTCNTYLDVYAYLGYLVSFSKDGYQEMWECESETV